MTREIRMREADLLDVMRRRRSARVHAPSAVPETALAAVLPTNTDGQALFPVLQALSLSEVPVKDEYLLDADTEDDLARVTQLLDQLEGRQDD